MSSTRDVLIAAAGLARQGKPFVLVTVTATEGSTPRDAGAKMLWLPWEPTDEAPLMNAQAPGGLVGTVGGGQFELLVTESARRRFDARSSGAERFVLGAEAEQCCGGVVEVFIEYVGPCRRLVIFGAGHVAHALVGILRAAPLEPVVVDDRIEWNSPERFGPARRITEWDEGVRVARAHAADTLACVMTCSHETDFRLLRGLLAGDAPASPGGAPAFVGLIGSRSKRACLFRRLVASGIDEARVLSIHCPIGLGDMGKEPELVAVSIAGQLLLEAGKLEPSSHAIARANQGVAPHDQTHR